LPDRSDPTLRSRAVCKRCSRVLCVSGATSVLLGPYISLRGEASEVYNCRSSFYSASRALIRDICQTSLLTVLSRKVVFCPTGPYLTRRATIGRLANSPLAGGGSLAPPYVPPPHAHKYNGLYGPGFISVMTPRVTPYPPSRRIEPPFSVGEVREVVENIHPGEDFSVRFTARPRMGGRRAVGRQRRGDPRRDRPLKGSRPRPPLEGRAVTRLGSLGICVCVIVRKWCVSVLT
jgi:hypothetical protein